MDTRFKQKRRILASLEAFFRRKTYRGFSERVLAVEDLAPPFQDALRTYIDPDDPVEIILIAPPQSILAEHKGLGWWPKDLLPWEITPDHCLVLTSQNLLIVTLPQHEDKPAVIQIPLGQILSLEVGTILLSGLVRL